MKDLPCRYLVEDLPLFDREKASNWIEAFACSRASGEPGKVGLTENSFLG